MHKLLQKILAVGASAALAVGLVGCDAADGAPVSSSSAAPTSAQTQAIENTTANATLSDDQIAQASAPAKTEMKKKDLETAWPSGSPVIQLNGDNASCEGSGVSIDGSVITISQSGSYVLSGTLDNGRVIVEAPEDADVQLVLDDAQITSTDGTAMHFMQADKVILTLNEGTQNSVTDAENYADTSSEAPNAAIYAQTDLSINGSGTLTVTGQNNNGITTKDDLKVAGGTLNVTAVNHALKGKDSVSILDGSFTLKAGGDGIQADKDNDLEKGWIVIDGGTFKIDADNDGIQAETGITINGGEFDITTGGGYTNGEQKQAAHGFGGMRPQGDNFQDFDGTMPQRPGRGDKTPGSGQQENMPAQPSQNTESTGEPSNGVENAQTSTTLEETASSNDTQQGDPAAESSKASRPDKKDSGTKDAATSTATSDSYKGIKAGGILNLTGGTYTVNSADDAIHTNGSATLTGGTYTLSSGDDGIHADGELTVNADITVQESYEGLEACKIYIQGGNLDIHSSDDGVNAADGSGGFGAHDTSKFDIQVSGGTISAVCGGDGFDSNGDIHISDGDIYVLIDSTADNEAMDYEGAFTVTGGNLVYGGTGTGSGPGENSSQSYVYTQDSFNAGTEVSVRKDSQVLATFTPSIDCRALVFSTPGITAAESYDIYAGETLLTTTTAGEGASGMFGGRGPGSAGQMGNGEPPQMPNGEMPDGEPPQMPDGEMPDSEPPQMPDGSLQGSDDQTPAGDQAAQGQRPNRRDKGQKNNGSSAASDASGSSPAEENTNTTQV